jgi:hypothetical protein
MEERGRITMQQNNCVQFISEFLAEATSINVNFYLSLSNTKSFNLEQCHVLTAAPVSIRHIAHLPRRNSK